MTTQNRTVSNWMVYGATGYTGELVAAEAQRRGVRPILAGRNRERVEALGRRLDLPTRVVDLDDDAALARALEDVALVIHCAGPFVRTSRAMVEACLRTRTHYLDITGEIPVFESIFRRDDEARSARVVLLPGVGFDVVPTDCLAARLAAAMPDASHLELAFTAKGGSVSRGTLRTMLESLPNAGAIREDGKLRPVPLAFDAKEIEFSCGSRWAMTIPWGDLSTAFRSTGIPNIRVYTGRSPRGIRKSRRMRWLLPLAGWTPVKRFLQWRVGRTTSGPDARVRATARTFVWGQVENASGDRISGTLETPEAYAFTAVAAVECARRVLEGGVEPGAWTPSRAFGPDLVGELPGVTVGDLERAHPAPAGADDTREEPSP